MAIDHEAVTFASDSAEIGADQRAKLDVSLARIEEVVTRMRPFMKVTLYIAGHTDTVGPATRNRKLASRKFQAISWWRS